VKRGAPAGGGERGRVTPWGSVSLSSRGAGGEGTASASGVGESSAAVAWNFPRRMSSILLVLMSRWKSNLCAAFCVGVDHGVVTLGACWLQVSPAGWWPTVGVGTVGAGRAGSGCGWLAAACMLALHWGLIAGVVAVTVGAGLALWVT
jgi:hypothetical protein